ncbi:hypothetical protein EBS02_07875, partial [bacterium]|nr:hypothetical protein [bacterium]
MIDISGKITTEKTSNVQSTNPPEVQSTKSPKVHPNLFSSQLWSVQPTSLKDISRLPFSVMKPLQSISGMAPPPGFIDSSHSGIIANNSCSLLLFLKNLGASKKQMKWAKELVNSGRLPTEFKLDSFIQLMKNIKANKKTTDLKMLSKLIEGFLNLFQTNVEKKEKSKKDVESFLKHSHERAPCAKGGEGKKDKKDKKRMEVLQQKIAKLQQLLAGAKKQPD